jgi:hypothetical protein
VDGKRGAADGRRPLATSEIGKPTGKIAHAGVNLGTPLKFNKEVENTAYGSC